MTLAEEVWTAKAKVHAERFSSYADAFVNRREIGKSHPVHDFLFTYYSFSPQKLKQWVPSFEEHLQVNPHVLDIHPWLNSYWFCIKEHVLSFNPERIKPNLTSLVSFVANLCDNILKQPPRFGCFGLHEWAMVYKAPPETIRHYKYALRLPSKDINALVESQTICCTHYDAYRFFTKDASPLNILNPRLETRLHMEQSGCLHANMDLYKWASKLWPWIGSDYIGKTFLLALEGRELDMRASPYDLRKDGYEPICIETEEGRRQYQKSQQRLTELSTPLREELLAFCHRILRFC